MGDAAVDTEQVLPGADQAAGHDQAEQIQFTIIFGKVKQEVTRSLDSTVAELKQLVQESTRIVADGQKLLNKGVPLKDDALSLRQAGIKQGAKLMLIGTPAPEVESVAAIQATAGVGSTGEWDAPVVPDGPVSAQPQHAKVLAKGKPEDAVPGIAGRQIPMPDELVMLTGMCNSAGTRIRLTFKSDTQELWIGSAERTQKVPYGSITRIESWPIEEQPEYSLVSLQLGSGKYWVYWFPSQFVASLKIRIIGLHALL